MTVAIRGAITVEENDREQIYEATSEMMQQIIELNNINTTTHKGYSKSNNI